MARALLGVFFALLAAPGPAATGSNAPGVTDTWVSHGPPGVVLAIAASPSNSSDLFAGMYLGVSRTGNAGRSWSPAGAGDLTYVRTIEVDPEEGRHVYVGTADGGVYESTDAGTSWTTRNTGIDGDDIEDILIDPTTSSTLYATSVGHGVFKSTNSGLTWRAMNVGLGNLHVGPLAIDPADPERLFVGASGSDVFRSTDGAVTWTRVYHQSKADHATTTIVIDPTSPETVYFASFLDGVFKSTDGGDSWVNSSGGMSRGKYMGPLAIDPLDPEVLYAGHALGLYRSEDGARTWNPVGNLIHQFNGLAFDPKNPSILWAATTLGVFRSRDAASSWQARSDGLTGGEVHDLSISTDGKVAFAVNQAWGDSAWRSGDGGRTWHQLEGLEGFDVFQVAIDPFNPSIAYVGATGDGMFKTIDGGRTWTRISSGLLDTDVRALAVDPETPTTLYAGTFFDGGDEGLYKSTDGGATWFPTALTGDVDAEVAIAPSNSSILYAAGGENVYRSEDAGSSWERISRGFCNGLLNDVAIHPSDPMTAVVGTGNCGIYITHDAGQTWTQELGDVPGINAVAYSSDGSAMFIANQATGISVSTDDGHSWTVIDEGLTDPSALTLEVNPATNTLWGGFDLEGVAVRQEPMTTLARTLSTSSTTYSSPAGPTAT